MTYINMELRCPFCGGDGFDGMAVCGHCTEGWLPSNARINAAEIIEKIHLTNVFDSYEIIEAIDTSEYNALTADQKTGVALLLSCGRVNLNEGKAGRTRLLAWFGGGSTTIANLSAMLE